MTFDDLKDYIDAADEAIKVCEEKKGDFPTMTQKALEHLTTAKSLLKEAKSENALAGSDTAEDLQRKAKKLYKALEKATKEQLKVADIQTSIAEFLEDILEENITQAAQNVFKYRKFRTQLQTTLTNTKLEMAIAITQLLLHLKNEGTNSDILSDVNVFLEELRKLNFYETTKDDKNRILDVFKEMTHQYWIFKSNRQNNVRKGAKKEYKKPLKELLDKAIDYTENSKICWAHCHRLRDRLDNNKYINEVRTELKVLDFENTLTIAMKDIARIENSIKKMIQSFAPEKAEEMLGKLDAVELPKEIDWLKKAYNLSTWAYENYGEDLGSYLGLEQEAPFEFEVAAPGFDAEVYIPGFHAGFMSVGFEFGASLKANAKFDGKLQLHNFLSAAEPKYVSGELNASAGLEASVFAGIALVILELIKASGRVTLTGNAGAVAKANVELTKRNLDQIAAFTATGSAGLAFSLKGELEAVIGLTGPVKFLIKTLTGAEPEKKITSPPLDLFEAKREAGLSFEMPFRKKPTSFPKNALKMDAGEWTVTFIGDEKIKAVVNDFFGGMNKFEKMLQEEPLTAKELEAVREMYGNFGERTPKRA
jgi:hypothetical protein